MARLEIELRPEEEQQLAQQARVAGLSLPDYARRQLFQGLAPAGPSGDDEFILEQTRLRQVIDDLLAQARALTPQPRRDTPRPPEETAVGDAIADKFRRQGFHL